MDDQENKLPPRKSRPAGGRKVPKREPPKDPVDRDELVKLLGSLLESDQGSEKPTEVEEKAQRKKLKIDRSGQMAESTLRPIAEMVQEATEKRSVDQGELAEEVLAFEEPEERYIPMGWFFLVGLVLVGVIVWMVSQILSDDRNLSEADGGQGGAGRGPNELVGVESREAADRHLEGIVEVVSSFMTAETVEERAKYVRHPERVLPLMKQFYERGTFRTYTFRLISDYRAYSLSFLPFLVLTVDTEDQQSVPMLLEDTPEGLLVDWESFVCYQPVSPDDYAENRPTEPVSLRAYGTVDNFFVYEFSEEKYGCLRLEFRNSDTVLFGYVEKGSEVDQKINQFFRKGGKLKKQPMILRLRFLEESKEKRCVLIEDVRSFLWAYPTDPGQESKTGG